MKRLFLSTLIIFIAHVVLAQNRPGALWSIGFEGKSAAGLQETVGISDRSKTMTSDHRFVDGDFSIVLVKEKNDLFQKYVYSIGSNALSIEFGKFFSEKTKKNEKYGVNRNRWWISEEIKVELGNADEHYKFSLNLGREWAHFNRRCSGYDGSLFFGHYISIAPYVSLGYDTQCKKFCEVGILLPLGLYHED